MRTRAEVGKEMLDVCAHAQAAAAKDDDVSYELDHTKLTDLLYEWEAIPLQSPPHPGS
jgi:hypothetical protein